jgi:hypothetical protein
MPANQSQDTLRRWWNQAAGLKIDAPSEYEQLKARMVLRAGNFTVTASKRRGYIVLTASC